MANQVIYVFQGSQDLTTKANISSVSSVTQSLSTLLQLSGQPEFFFLVKNKELGDAFIAANELEADEPPPRSSKNLIHVQIKGDNSHITYLPHSTYLCLFYPIISQSPSTLFSSLHTTHHTYLPSSILFVFHIYSPLHSFRLLISHSL